jgi:hypothetical protein
MKLTGCTEDELSAGLLRGQVARTMCATTNITLAQWLNFHKDLQGFALHIGPIDLGPSPGAAPG